jgi:cell wall-associated NlpC family hydrolase
MKTTPSALLVICLIGMAWGQPDSKAKPRHLADAVALLKKLDLKDTSYEHGGGKVSFAGTVQSHTDCSGFIDALLQHSYGYDEAQFKAWFGSKRPTAARYHDQILRQNGFNFIPSIPDTRPGDLLAVKYFNRKDNTGHVMLVSGQPKKMEARKPLIDGTEQWEVKVIDSSMSGHGTTDTRHAKGKDGKDHEGLGEGVLRIYTDKQGKIAGFSWSTLTASKFLEPKEEELVVGRLKPMFKP